MKKRTIRERIGSVALCFAVAAAMCAPFASAPPTAAAADTASEAGKAPVFSSAKNYGGAYTDAFQNVEYTQDGGFVAAGYTMGDSTDPEWTYHTKGTSHTNNDAVLVKFDKDHKVEWSKAYGDTGVDVFNDMTILGDGRIAAIGRSSVPSTFDGKTIKGVSWWLLIVDPQDPDIVTEYRIGGSGGDHGYGVAATSDGGFVVTGWTASQAGYYQMTTDGTNYTDPVQLWEAADGTDEAIPNRVASKSSETVVVKFDKAGEPVFTSLHQIKVMDHPDDTNSPQERVEGLAVDGNDDILITGSNQYCKNVTNAFIAKLDGKDGHLIWHRAAGNETLTPPTDPADQHKDTYSAVSVLKDGSYVVTGATTNDAQTEEGWDCISQKDILVVRYSADGKVMNAESFGVINDTNSRSESLTETPDGGYMVCGSVSGVMREDEEMDKGYDWGSYGFQDAILVKYDRNDKVEWAKNYGTSAGDWINDVTIADDGEIIAVGESNGKNGVPAWSNNGGIDAVVMCTNMYESAYVAPQKASDDGAVVWADGVYSGFGDGYNGEKSVEMQVVVKGHLIDSVSCISSKDTKRYFREAEAIYPDIIEKQSADVDVVSGATLSSNGIKGGVKDCLGQAAAKSVDALIAKIAEAEDADAKKAACQTAADAYRELGTIAVASLKGKDTLEAACSAYGVELVSREESIEQSIREIKPEKKSDLRFNDPYYKLQYPYYDVIGMPAFADNDITGRGVKIAVIDSGITPKHKDIDYSRILPGYDYDNNIPMGTGSEGDLGYTDVNGHGTAVSGIIAAKANNKTGIAGILSGVEIIPLRVTAKKTDESSRIVAGAIRDAVDKYDADVITTSLDTTPTEELKSAVEYAAEKGVIITGASGNKSANDISTPDDYVYPASYEAVISVGATDQNGKVRSNSTKNDQVFVAAPGEDIALLDISRNSRCKLGSGTSYASPVVAAMAAAAKQEVPDITPDQFRELLKMTCADEGEEGYDIAYGNGIVDFTAFTKAMKDEWKVTLDKKALTLDLGATDKLNAAVTETWSGSQGVEWSSSDESIVKVDEEGNLTAVAAGKAVVTAASKAKGSSKAECSVSVVDPFDIAGADVSVKGMTYTGSRCMPAPTVKVRGTALKNGSDYTVSWKNNINAGKASLTVTGTGSYHGTKTIGFTIAKANQKMTVKAAAKKVKFKKVRRKKLTIGKVITVKNARGAVSYKTVKYANKKSKKALKINAKTGKITVKKGTKKGVYRMTVAVTANGDNNFNRAMKNVNVTIKVAK